MLIVRLGSRILKLQSFVADVPEISVAAVAGVCGEGKVDAVGLAVVDLILTGLHGPYVCHSPGGNNFQIRGQADLIIAFSRRTVTDGRGSFLSRNLHQLFGDAGAGHGGSQQIFVFVDCTCLNTGNNIVVTEVIHNVLDIEL